jgi:TIR domain
VQGLLAHGIDVWYDEHDLSEGVIRDKIEQELASRNHFIVVLSPAAVQSRWVSRECNAALDLEDEGQLTTLLPVIAEPCTIPLMLRGYMRIQRPDGGALSPEEAANQVARVLTRRQQN